MKVFLARLLFISFLFLNFSAIAKSFLFEQVNDLKQMETVIKKEHFPAKEILVVFDIDDTLLEAKHFVGSDKWYLWQRGKAVFSQKDNKAIKIKADEKFNCIFSTLGVLFDLGSSQATQPDTVELVNRLQQQYDLLLLTSRSPNYRGATERELKKTGFKLSSAHLMTRDRGLSYPFNDGSRTAKVSYHNAVAMSSGLNKGLVLNDLLFRLKRNYSAIYFIDDNQKNVSQMKNAWQSSTSQVSIFHYTRVNKKISASEISDSNQAKSEFDQFLKTAFPETFDDFSHARCH